MYLFQNADANQQNPAVSDVPVHACPEGVFSDSPISYSSTLSMDIQALAADGMPSLQAEYDYTFQLNVSKHGHPPSELVQRQVHVETTAAPVVDIVYV